MSGGSKRGKFKWHGKKVMSVTDQAKIKALTAGALVVHGAAVNLSAIDTGNLRGSISYTVDNAVYGQDSGGGKAASKDQYIKPTSDKDAAYIGTNVEYAPFLEFGTSKMDAQPFLRPALDNNKAKVARLMKKIIRDAIKKG